MSDSGASRRNEHSAVDRTIEAILDLSYRKTITVEDFGSWAQMVELIPSLIEHPLLVVVARVLVEYKKRIEAEEGCVSEEYERSVRALAQAITATKSPVIFRDSIDQVLRSNLVELIGSTLAGVTLEQAAQPPVDATPSQELRAADALETAAQLCLGGWGHKWNLFSRLESFDGRSSGVYARAVLRATVMCVEQWVAAEDLVPVARRIAGLEQPLASVEGHTGGALVDESDAGLALARIATLQALRSTDRNKTVALLEDAVRYLAPGLDNDERPDMEVAADIARLLQNLVTIGAIGDPNIVERLAGNVRELLHLDPGRDHWVRDRVAASHAAWSKLAVQLAEAHRHLAEPSWYQAAAVIDDVVDLYRTTSSLRTYSRSEDGAAVHAIIAPTLAAGFAEQASLLRHLEDHVRHLEDLQRLGKSTPQQLQDLPVAIDMRDAAVEQLRNPDWSGILKVPAGVLSADEGALADLAETESAVARVYASVERRRAGRLNSTSLIVDELLERARAGFADSPDYEGEVAEATDFVTHLLVMFLWDRNQIGESEAEYLYREDADEKDLASDLRQFLRASGQLGSVTTEVRHVSGGRIDVQFGFPGFNLYVELKQDATKVPVPDKSSYLNQSASYQVADQRIGFLLALKLLPAKKTLAPHLSDCLEVVKVLDVDGRPRHVAALTLSGARTKPSDM
ncbi:hypothetical protein [Nonomuraea sp. B19D2]|uniref:hypothetical protein n=1 Tax=Nonomuraea sp. B19D2 TaxID=3159561 RepID=UPI0032DB7054